MLMEDVERTIEKREVVARRKTEREDEKGKFWCKSAAAASQSFPPCRGTTKEKKRKNSGTEQLLIDFG
jgi:hypothetical protein